MVTAIAIDPRADSYADVEKMVHKVCHVYHGKFGGEYDEYFSVANEAYLRAYDRYEPGRGEFTTMVWACCRNAILNWLDRLRRDRLVFVADVDPNAANVITLRSRFDLELFLRMASEDARLVVGMALEAPIEVMEALIDREAGPAVRRGLRSHLRRLGWTVWRIAETFQEIREALR